MTDRLEAISAYIAIWNTEDGETRRALLNQLFTEDGSYVDPFAEASGVDQINAVIEGGRALFPGHEFSLNDDVDHHHDVARFTWNLSPVNVGEPTAVGFDVLTFADDGRIRSVAGFIDKAPAA